MTDEQTIKRLLSQNKPHIRLHVRTWRGGLEWWADSSPWADFSYYTTGPTRATARDALRFVWRRVPSR